MHSHFLTETGQQYEQGMPENPQWERSDLHPAMLEILHSPKSRRSAPMNMLETIITNHPFTRDLNPHYLHLLIECATYERFGAQQQIFQESFDADHFYLIHSGSVALQTFAPGQGIITVQTIGAGDALGWSWLFPPHRWHLGAVAVEPTEAAVLGARGLRAKMEENHDFGYAIAMRIGQLMLERLKATRARLLEYYDVPRVFK